MECILIIKNQKYYFSKNDCFATSRLTLLKVKSNNVVNMITF